MNLSKQSTKQLISFLGKSYKFDYLFSLVNLLLRKGYKQKSFLIISHFLFMVKKRFHFLFKRSIKKGFVTLERIFNKVFRKYVPAVSFVSRKVAAITYHLPWYITKIRGVNLFIRWFFASALERTENDITDCSYNEFIDISLGYGKTIRKVEEYLRLAKKNRPFFAHLKKKRRVFRSRLKKFGI